MKYIEFLLEFMLIPFLYMKYYLMGKKSIFLTRSVRKMSKDNNSIGQHAHSFLALIALLLIAISPASVLAESEPNNSCAQANLLLNTNSSTDSGWLNGTVNNGSDIDWYKIVLTQKAEIRFDRNQRNNKKTKLRLYKSNCSTNAGWYTNSKNSHKTLTLESGTYYIKVWRSNANNAQYKVKAKLTKLTDFQVSKVADTGSKAPGDMVSYTIKVKNNGPTNGKVHITDVLPSGLTYDSQSNCSHSGNGIDCKKWINSGNTLTITLKATVDAGASGTLTNTVDIEKDNTNNTTKKIFETNLGNNSASADVSVAAVDEITSYTAPSEVTQGETITVTVAYNVSEAREIVTGIQQNHSPWTGWGWTTVNVAAGTGTVDIQVDIPSDLTIGNGYQIPIVLQPVGGDWDSRLDNKNENPVNVIASSCHGCDCSLDDNNVNNNAAGVVIPDLDGATTSVTKCISGFSDNNEDSDDKKDYYYFNVQTDGVLTIAATSPNSQPYHLRIGTTNGGDDIKEYNPTSASWTSGSIVMNAGDGIYIYIKETGSELDEYQLDFDFQPTTCDGCDCSLDDDNINHSSPGQIIPTLHGATTSVSKCISGTSTNGDPADYYYFTVQTSGVLKTTASSPDSSTFHLKMGSSENGNEYYGDQNDPIHTVPDITLSAGDSVYIYVKESGLDTDSYEMNFNFIADNSGTYPGPDICYESRELKGINIFGFGFFYKETTTVRTNVSGITDINVKKALTRGLAFANFFSGLGIGGNDKTPQTGDDEAEHRNFFGVDFVPNSYYFASMFPKGYDYRLGTGADAVNGGSLNPGDTTSYYDKALFKFGLFTGYTHLVTYTLNGTQHQEVLQPCDADNTYGPLTPSPVIEGCGVFIGALNSNEKIVFDTAAGIWQTINNQTTLNTPLMEDDQGTALCDGQACTADGVGSTKIALPAFLISQETDNINVPYSMVIADQHVGNLITNNDTDTDSAETERTIVFEAPYSPSYGKRVLLIQSITDNDEHADSYHYVFKEGDYWIGSWAIQGAKNVTIETVGNVRIFVDNSLSVNITGSLNIGHAGAQTSPKFYMYVNNDFTLDVVGSIAIQNSYIYAKGKMDIKGSTTVALDYGALTADKVMTISNGAPSTFNYYEDTNDMGGIFQECLGGECQTLGEGFHIVDPDGGVDDNSFEIFCHEDSSNIWHTLIALPMKNSSNNFVFSNRTTSANYYSLSDNPRKDFHAIEVDIDNITYSGTLNDGTTPRPHIPVVIGATADPYTITMDNGNSYKVMGSTFSNINLIGTPFKIEWDQTDALGGCDESKLRKALDQAVKYNTLVADGQSICTMSTMTLSLLDDYRFLSYLGDEVLQHSCKEMAAYVPNNIGILDDNSVAGHFNILTSEPAYGQLTPTSNGLRDEGTDIGARTTDGGNNARPITVYCKYQTDLHYVWTFLTALDAKVTLKKTDIVSHQDSCSQMGLYFYVPNSKETFNRVRKYLKEQKTGDSGWENYTGTIDEKIRALHSGNRYYISHFRDVKIWPYGPLGVYFPQNGNHEDDGTSHGWRGANDRVKGWMSGAPMHNINSMSNYNESMGKKGWVSILGSRDLNKTEDWWIADIGAGEEIGQSTPNTNYDPQGDHPIQSSGYVYYEPNGNYTKYAWLNFLFDDEGWIYHNDDWNANYPYYDYMCMSETNYDRSFRYQLVPGFFEAIERGTTAGNTAPNFSDVMMRTKVVNQSFNLDILLYENNASSGYINRNALETNDKKSVGVYLATKSANGGLVLVKNLGALKDFDLSNGRIQLPPITLDRAYKELFVHFYYCDAASDDWDTCWSDTGTVDAPIVSPIVGTDGKEVDSTDMFAMRPSSFAIDKHGVTTTKAGVGVLIDYMAKDNIDHDTLNYDEVENNSFSVSGTLPSGSSGCTNQTVDRNRTVIFSDGRGTGQSYFKSVGAYTVTIHETLGSEYAKIDVNDTAESDRLITPSSYTMYVAPAYFDLTVAYSDKGSAFTYLYNITGADKNMSATLDVTILAKIADGTNAENYEMDCYGEATTFTVGYAMSAIRPVGALTKLIVVDDSNITRPPSQVTLPTTPTTSSNFNMSFNKSIFGTTGLGTGHISLKINFDRKPNKAVDPFRMNIKNVNLSDSKTSGSKNVDANATFYYGRIHAPRVRSMCQNSGNCMGEETFYYEVYADKSADKSLLPTGAKRSRDSVNWYGNSAHSNADGNITGSTPNNLQTSAITYGAASGESQTVQYQYDGTRGYPFKGSIRLDSATGEVQKWLIYDRYNPAATSVQGELEFYGPGKWSGTTTEAESTIKDSNDANRNKNTNRRIRW